MMRRELIMMLLLAFSGAVGAARADFVAAPNFSTDETETIARVQILTDLLRGDPWLLRLVLDMASQLKSGAGERSASAPLSGSPTTRDALGIVNWNELVRKARQRKEQRRPVDASTSTRSAQGIVDANDWIRKAKAKKESGVAP